MLSRDVVGCAKKFTMLALTFHMIKIYLKAANAPVVMLEQRCLQYLISMMWLASIDSISDTSKINLTCESISSVLLVLFHKILKIEHAKSEPHEHTFGMIRQKMQELTVCQLIHLLVVKSRRFQLIFRVYSS